MGWGRRLGLWITLTYSKMIDWIILLKYKIFAKIRACRHIEIFAFNYIYSNFKKYANYKLAAIRA